MKAILNTHESVFISPPMPLFECFGPIMEAYGDLTEDSAWGMFLEDVAELLKVNHQPLPEAADVEELPRYVEERGRSRQRDLGLLIDCVYGFLCDAMKARVRGCKYSTNMDNLGEFLRLATFDRIIYQVRDPRDVVLSQFSGGFHEADHVAAARSWATAQRNARRHVRDSGIPALTIRYEDLVQDTDAVSRRIADFIGVDAFPDSATFHLDDLNRAAAERTHMWENLGRPMIRDNFNTYRRQWNSRAVREIELAAGEELDGLGYRRSWPWQFRSLRKRTPSRREITPADRDYISPQLRKWAEITERAHRRAARRSGAVSA